MSSTPGIPRRRFIETAAGALAAAPAWAGEADDPMAAAQDPTGRLTVATWIDGNGPFRFLVDTGAVRTVIADEVAALLGLVPGAGVLVHGIVGSVATRLVEVHDLRFGPVVLTRLAVPTLPREGLGADGYLGLDAIDGNSVTFDLARGEITVASPLAGRSRPATPFEITLPLQGEAGRLKSLDCRVDGIRATAFVDTGAAFSVGNARLSGALARRVSSYNPVDLVGIVDVTERTTIGHAAVIDRVELGALAFTNPVIAIADLPIFDLWGLADRPALLIGMSFLRQFARVTIDYGAKAITLDLGRAAAPPR